jgi:hypothetical protein
VSDGAQIVKRAFLIGLLERYLAPHPAWTLKNNGETDPRHSPYHHVPYSLIHGKHPCVSIKSHFGLTYITGVDGTPKSTREELPYWGNVQTLRTKFL